MIIQLESINYCLNSLLYCQKGGEILYSNECLGNANDIYKQMKQKELLNDRCLKKTFHIKMRIAPEDKGLLNNQNWIDISKSYAKKFGFENNLYAVYIHEENSEKEHIHLVASRIQDNNLAVRDNYTHYRNMDFAREVEKKYKLRKVERRLEAIRKEEVFISKDKRVILLKDKILKAISFSDSLEDLTFILKNQKIEVKIGRGISFTDENGIKKKGSAIDRKLSLSGIKKMMTYNEQEIVQQKKNIQRKFRNKKINNA